MRLVLLALLLAPAGKKQWSEAFKVGLSIPSTWTIVARDTKDSAFVIDGPELGAATPRAVLKYGGGAGETSLDAFAKQLVEAVGKRDGWRIVASTRKRIGPYPCVRVGIAFVEDGNKKGRARFTVALLGGRFFVLELSAAASHFPGKQFDRIEASLEVPWNEHRLQGLVWKVPEGWNADAGAIDAPPMGFGRCVLLVRRGAPPPKVPPDSVEGPKMMFLGKKRPTQQAPDIRLEDGVARLVQLRVRDWSVAVMMPVAVWDDLFPMMEAVLASAKKPEKK